MFHRRRPFLWTVILAGLWSSQGLQARQQAAAPGPVPLASYVPEKNLLLLVEWDGFDQHKAEWSATAAHRMLSETTLGQMLSQTLVQSLNGLRGVNPMLGAVSGKDVTELVDLALSRGFVLGLCGNDVRNKPEAASLVLRGAKENAFFLSLLEKSRLAGDDQPQVRQVGNRTVTHVNDAEWWFDGNDFVISLAFNNQNPTLEALSGQTSSALNHPVRKRLAAADTEMTPIGWAFLDVTRLPMPKDARDLGLDGVRTVSYRWGVQGKSIVSQLMADAPAPRRGLLSLFEQPALDPRNLPPVPANATGYTLFSLAPAAGYENLLKIAGTRDANAPGQIEAQRARIQEMLQVDLKRDLAEQLGPGAAAFTLPAPVAGSLGGVFDLWFFLPRGALVIQVKDRAAFSVTLERLINSANRALARAGGLFVNRQPRAAGLLAARAEFRKMKSDDGYILAVPPAVLPTPGALKLTILLGQKHLIIGTTTEVARAALKAESEGTPPPNLGTLPAGTTVYSQSDPRGSLPELLVNIPSLSQWLGSLVAESTRRGPPGRSPLDQFSLNVDPELIPDPDTLRSYLFPSISHVTITDQGLTYTTNEAFPSPSISTGVGTSGPVLVALLLPAVQSAREAARRAQCTNNLKQIALAVHNFESANGHLPGDILSKDGKPLLSWRVAILPFLEQQALFDQFHLDEPWDSEHNLRLANLVVATYRCPSDASTPATETHYLRFVGNGALFDAVEPTKFVQVADGTSNTILVAEASKSVPWTKPDDIAFDPENTVEPLLGLGSLHPGGLNAAFADGSVRFIKTTVAGVVLKALITRSGGEVVSGDQF